MALPEHSVVLVAVHGDAYSTVSDATANYAIASVGAEEAAAATICEWMFNSKTITVHNYAPGPLGYDYTLTFHHSGAPSGTQGVEASLPANFINGEFITCPAMTNDPQNGRWVDDSGNPSNELFYAFIWRGSWYWTPGFLGIDSESIGVLSDSSFVRSGTYEDGPDTYPVTVTTTITERFFEP